MEETLAKIRQFRDERDWKQFHDPRSLAISVCIESAELLEHFQWKNDAAAVQHTLENRSEIADEIADVAIYLFELADVLGIDMKQAILAKLEKNAVKYPIAKSRGKSTKYDKL